VVQVVVDKPLAQGFDYLWDQQKLGQKPLIGKVVQVPFGRSTLIGVVIKVSDHSDFDINKLKTVTAVAPLPSLDSAALRLMNFASQYYIHGLGETIVPTIPQMWKKPEDWEKIPKKLAAAEKKKEKKDQEAKSEGLITQSQLNLKQQRALSALQDCASEKQFKAILLQGQTGSGKTAVFLNWLSSILEDEEAQVLILVPEINLTPQLERRVRAYFPNKNMAVLHSAIPEKQRGVAWYEAMTGKAPIILGTRLAALTPLPNLKAIFKIN
jgi:primosomal protein N' (replication factor Y)